MTASPNRFVGPVVILMTATIRPALRSDAEVAERLAEYSRALTFWLRYPDARISGVVVCDNSGHSLEPLRSVIAACGSERPAELLAGARNDIPAGMHYGYAEMAVVEHAVAASRLLRDSHFFAKATGRLTFPRFGKLLDRLPPDWECALDYYRAPRRLEGRYRARTQLMLFKTECFRRVFSGTRTLMTARGISHIEEVIPALIAPGQGSDTAGYIFRWPIECTPSGIGGNGQRYDGLRYQAKAWIRGAMRVCVPWIWK